MCDSVTETYAVDASPSIPQSFFADVWYRPGVTDAVGESVLKAILDLNIMSMERAFSGTRYEFCRAQTQDAESAKNRLLQFVNRQLLNPLIQECRISKV